MEKDSAAPISPFHLTTCVGSRSANGLVSVLSSAHPIVASENSHHPENNSVRMATVSECECQAAEHHQRHRDDNATSNRFTIKNDAPEQREDCLRNSREAKRSRRPFAVAPRPNKREPTPHRGRPRSKFCSSVHGEWVPRRCSSLRRCPRRQRTHRGREARRLRKAHLDRTAARRAWSRRRRLRRAQRSTPPATWRPTHAPAFPRSESAAIVATCPRKPRPNGVSRAMTRDRRGCDTFTFASFPLSRKKVSWMMNRLRIASFVVSTVVAPRASRRAVLNDRGRRRKSHAADGGRTGA